MDDERSKALMELNSTLINYEYSESSYKKRTASLILQLIREMKFSELYSLVYLKICGKNKKRKNIPDNMKVPNSFCGDYIVYTCIIGNYDNPVEPLYTSNRCRYVLISDKNIVRNGSSWEWMDISEYDIPCERPNEINRYVKLHPELFFKNYEYSVYIDGNIQVVADMLPLINAMGSSVIGLHRHDRRDCAYEEADTFFYIGSMKKYAQKAKEQMRVYEMNGFPHHFGLFENPIIVRKHNDAICINIMKEWWNQLTTYTMRDQISFPYVVWKLGIKEDMIYILGGDLRKNPRFRQYKHLV